MSRWQRLQTAAPPTSPLRVSTRGAARSPCLRDPGHSAQLRFPMCSCRTLLQRDLSFTDSGSATSREDFKGPLRPQALPALPQSSAARGSTRALQAETGAEQIRARRVGCDHIATRLGGAGGVAWRGLVGSTLGSALLPPE